MPSDFHEIARLRAENDWLWDAVSRLYMELKPDAAPMAPEQRAEIRERLTEREGGPNGSKKEE